MTCGFPYNTSVHTVAMLTTGPRKNSPPANNTVKPSNLRLAKLRRSAVGWMVNRLNMILDDPVGFIGVVDHVLDIQYDTSRFAYVR